MLDGVAQKFPDTYVLIEDFKPIDTEYAVVGFSDGENVVMPGVIEFIANSQSHFGIAREGKIRPVAGFEQVLSQFAEFVRRIGFFGLFDIDFWESGGVLYFDEMNFRFGGSGYAYTAMGANLPVRFVYELRREPCMTPEVKGTSTYVNERMAVEDWNFRYLTEEEMRAMIARADIRFVYDERDPGPGRALERLIRQLRLKRTLRKWL